MAATAETRPAVAVATQQRRPGYYLDAIIRYVLLTVLALIFVAPFVLSFLGTFKNNAELTAYPPTILPANPTTDNWARVWNFRLPSVEGPLIPRWFFNSTWLAILNVITQLFFSALAAYAFARIRFPGSSIIFAIMIATLAIPASVTMLPGYVFYARLGWVNTFWPLIVPRLIDVATIFTLTQFFKSLPKELEEAAFLDGTSRFGTFWRIALPLSVPILITMGILRFQGSWNDYLTPLLFLQDPAKMTLTVGMGFFKGQYSNDYGAQLVGAMFNAIPVLVLFGIFSRYFVNTGSRTGLAGM